MDIKKTAGQFSILLSGLFLIVVISVMTVNLAVFLAGIVFLAITLAIASSSEGADALKEGLVVLASNVAILVTFVLIGANEPNLILGMIGSGFLMMMV